MNLAAVLFFSSMAFLSFANADEQSDPNEKNDIPYVCADEYCTTKEPATPKQPDYCETGSGCYANTPPPAHSGSKKQPKPILYCDPNNLNDCIVVYK